MGFRQARCWSCGPRPQLVVSFHNGLSKRPGSSVWWKAEAGSKPRTSFCFATEAEALAYFNRRRKIAVESAPATVEDVPLKARTAATSSSTEQEPPQLQITKAEDIAKALSCPTEHEAASPLPGTNLTAQDTPSVAASPQSPDDADLGTAAIAPVELVTPRPAKASQPPPASRPEAKQLPGQLTSVAVRADDGPNQEETQTGMHLPDQLTPVAGSMVSQPPPVSVGKARGKPGMKAYMPHGKPFRYLSANAVKVHLWLLRHHDRAVPPTGLETEYTLYGECTIAKIGQGVKMLDRTVYRALDELVDFGLIRRERRRSEGVVIGLAYWLKPAPPELTGPAIQRIKGRLINEEIRTEEAKRELAQDGIVFDGDAQRKAAIKAMFD